MKFQRNGRQFIAACNFSMFKFVYIQTTDMNVAFVGFVR